MDKNKSIIFMGTPDFAVASLEAILQAGIQVKAVVTATDKPAGRGHKLQHSAVKKCALQHNIPVLQPEKLKDSAFLEELASYEADLFVVVAFRMLPKLVWDMPQFGTINLHASLLPQYRGAAPINWAVINGEKETGATTFFIEEEIDTGKIIDNTSIPISENDTAGTVHDRLMNAGAKLLVDTITSIFEGNAKALAQSRHLENEAVLKAAPKIFKPDCAIRWDRKAEAIHNHIRGLSPYPAAFSDFTDSDGKKHSLKIFRSSFELSAHQFETGSVIAEKNAFKIACADGFICPSEIQPAGKKRMPANAFLRGTSVEGWKAG